ncbi:MAG: hypothetical protein Q8M18_12125 [Bradyrhizobium sp.]|nr:hypothetical protein [Bradyrhizobium sp.]
MEILEASAPSKIVIELDFYTPLEARNTAEFTMLPHGRRHQRQLANRDSRVPDAVQRAFGDAPQSRDPRGERSRWTPDQQRTVNALHCVRGTPEARHPN